MAAAAARTRGGGHQRQAFLRTCRLPTPRSWCVAPATPDPAEGCTARPHAARTVGVARALRGRSLARICQARVACTAAHARARATARRPAPRRPRGYAHAHAELATASRAHARFCHTPAGALTAQAPAPKALRAACAQRAAGAARLGTSRQPQGECSASCRGGAAARSAGLVRRSRGS